MSYAKGFNPSNARVPSTQRSRYLKLFRELIGPEKHWPLKTKNWILGKKHLDYKERFVVATFLNGNGVDPKIVKEYFRDCFPKFDQSATRQIDSVLKEFAKPGNKWGYFDVILGKYYKPK